MKKLYRTLSILCFISNISFAQWTHQFTSDYFLSKGLFINESTGFVVSTYQSNLYYEIGAVFKTTNGGISYIPSSDSFPDEFKNIFKEGNTIFAFGDYYRFLVTSDSGKYWQVKSHPVNFLFSSFFINENTGWVSSYGSISEIYKTTDKGDTWVFQYANSDTWIRSICFENELIGLATLSRDQGDIIRTTNGGLDWKIVYNGDVHDRFLNSIVFNNGKYFVTGGEYGDNGTKLLISSDHGVTWFSDSTSILRNFAITTLPYISFWNDSSGYIVANSGYIFRTTNNGVSWISQTYGNRNASFVFPLNDMFSWIISGDEILKTTNGGWDLPSAPYLQLPLNAYATTRDSVYFRWYVAFNALTYDLQISNDTAFTNNIDSNNIDKNFVSMTDLPPGIYYWRVRSNGVLGNSPWSSRRVFTILPSSIQQINSEIPETINLLQNYPNPFNPVTKIKFSVPANQFIKIIVYDIQGKKIQELVNKKVQAGNYETEFNGNNFSSGIYYYTLESEKFKATKKMLLIK